MSEGIEEEHAFSGYLAYTIKPLLQIYGEHLVEWDGEFFPYLWMADIARAMNARLFSEQDTNEILNALDHCLGQAGDRVQNLIAVGFVESLPVPNAAGRDIVAPHPNLEKQYLRVFGD